MQPNDRQGAALPAAAGAANRSSTGAWQRFVVGGGNEVGFLVYNCKMNLRRTARWAHNLKVAAAVYVATAAKLCLCVAAPQSLCVCVCCLTVLPI